MSSIKQEIAIIRDGFKLVAAGTPPAKYHGIIALLKRDGWNSFRVLTSHGANNIYARKI